MATIEQISSLKREVSDLKDSFSKSKGVLEQLCKENKIKDLKDVKVKIGTLSAEKEKLQVKFDTLLKKFTESYDTSN